MSRHTKLRACVGTLSLCASICAAESQGVAQQKTLVLSTFGISQESFRKHLYGPFESSCGCKVTFDVGNSSDRLAKLEARKDNPNVDIAVLSDFNALEAARKGLIEPIDVARLKNYGKLYEVAKDPIGGHFAVGYTFYATSILYRSDKLAITSWADLWKAELKGRLALPNITTTQGPLLLFMADRTFGGTTPDLATGIDKVADLKSSVVTFVERTAQLVQLFQQDEIFATVNGRFVWPLIKKLTMPIAWAYPKEGQTGGRNVLVLVKGSKNKDLALSLIDRWLSTETQTALAMDLVDSPANKEVVLPADVADSMTYGQEVIDSLKLIPPADLLSNRDAWIAGWNKKIAR